jgi:hypothetical protein
MARTVTKGTDGFWRVSGMDEDAYFTDEHHAKRVAENLDAADAAAEDEASHEPHPEA